MGVLNVTPDSFSDGGAFIGEAATRRVLTLLDADAFVVDIGGESTRPGALAIPAKEQLERVEPAIKCAVAEIARRSTPVWISVDTADPLVAETALGWGAHVINDVSCLADPSLARVVGKADGALILMHSRGPMAEMQGFSDYPDHAYGDVVAETADEWRRARDRAVSRGVSTENVLFDPGLGFAKNARQSMRLLERLGEFKSLSAPIVVGPSRKSFLKIIDGSAVDQRLGSTIAACLHAAANGASLVRVHDVDIVLQALRARRLLACASSNSEGRTEDTCSTVS